MMTYIGVDLHTNRFTTHFKEPGGKDRTASYNLWDKDIRRFTEVAITKDDYVFIEASTNTFAFSDLIKDRVKKVTVIDPFQFKAIANSSKKTDKIDARTLAKMGKYHVETGGNFLPEVYIVDKPIRKLRALFTTYNLINKEMTMVKNRIHSLFKQNLKMCNLKFILEDLAGELKSAGLDWEYEMQVRTLVEVLNCLVEKKEAIKKEILLLGGLFKEDIDILVSISGVSVFIALGMIADYATVARFGSAKKFSKYLRSTPRSEVSNKERKDGKTQKNGRKLSTKLLLQGLNHFLDTTPYLDKFYWRLKKGKGACKARTAIARKMLVIIYYMLKNREYYRFMKRELHDKKMREYETFLEKNKGA
jgi:transposase